MKKKEDEDMMQVLLIYLLMYKSVDNSIIANQKTVEAEVD